MKPRAMCAEVLGVGIVMLAALYFCTPAHSLPSFLPGFDPSLDTIHYKHGVASLIVGVALMRHAWSTTKKQPPGQ